MKRFLIVELSLKILSLEIILNEIPPTSLIEEKWMDLDIETAKVAVAIANTSEQPLFGNKRSKRGRKSKKNSGDETLASLVSKLQKQMANYVVKNLDVATSQIESLNLNKKSIDLIIDETYNVLHRKITDWTQSEKNK